MTTSLPSGKINECPICQTEIDAFIYVVKSRIPDSDTDPTAIENRAARVLTLGHYYQGILHQNEHPISLLNYGMNLKRDQVPVAKLHDCRTCQYERDLAVHRTDYLFPGFATNPERVQPAVLNSFYMGIYWLGMLHALDHPVALTDYAESNKTGDCSISPPPPGEASDDC